MSLKDLISTLIESAFTFKKSFIAEQPFPSTSHIEIISSDNTEQVDYVAPDSGYVEVSTKYINESGSIQLWDLTSNLTYQTYKQNANVRLKFYIPVKKGETVRKIGSLTVDGMRFTRCIGGVGGANRLLSPVQAWIRGGGLCLKTFSARLLKQCLRTRRATLRLSACPMVASFIKHIHRQQAPLSSRLMGGCGFKRSATVYKSILTRALLSSITKISNGHLSYCLSRKDRTSCITSLMDSSETYLFGLFTIKQTNNLATEVYHA